MTILEIKHLTAKMAHCEKVMEHLYNQESDLDSEDYNEIITTRDTLEEARCVINSLVDTLNVI